MLFILIINTIALSMQFINRFSMVLILNHQLLNFIAILHQSFVVGLLGFKKLTMQFHILLLKFFVLWVVSYFGWIRIYSIHLIWREIRYFFNIMTRLFIPNVRLSAICSILGIMLWRPILIWLDSNVSISE